MPSTIRKSFDDLHSSSLLANKVAIAFQNFIEARTAIRDYIISADQEHYEGVEELIGIAIEFLVDADTIMEKGESPNVINSLLDSIRDWAVIAREVHDGFVSYKDTVQKKVLVNLAACAESSNVLQQSNTSKMKSVMRDVQMSNVAIISYLFNGEDRLATDAQNAIKSAKTKITQTKQGNQNMALALQSFVDMLDTHASDFLKAVELRRNAYTKFNNRLATLGATIQTDLEEYYDEIIAIQEGINDLKILSQSQRKNGSPIH